MSAAAKSNNHNPAVVSSKIRQLQQLCNFDKRSPVAGPISAQELQEELKAVKTRQVTFAIEDSEDDEDEDDIENHSHDKSAESSTSFQDNPNVQVPLPAFNQPTPSLVHANLSRPRPPATRRPPTRLDQHKTQSPRQRQEEQELEDQQRRREHAAILERLRNHQVALEREPRSYSRSKNQPSVAQKIEQELEQPDKRLVDQQLRQQRRQVRRQQLQEQEQKQQQLQQQQQQQQHQLQQQRQQQQEQQRQQLQQEMYFLQQQQREYEEQQHQRTELDTELESATWHTEALRRYSAERKPAQDRDALLYQQIEKLQAANHDLQLRLDQQTPLLQELSQIRTELHQAQLENKRLQVQILSANTKQPNNKRPILHPDEDGSARKLTRLQAFHEAVEVLAECVHDVVGRSDRLVQLDTTIASNLSLF